MNQRLSSFPLVAKCDIRARWLKSSGPSIMGLAIWRNPRYFGDRGTKEKDKAVRLPSSEETTGLKQK